MKHRIICILYVIKKADEYILIGEGLKPPYLGEKITLKVKKEHLQEFLKKTKGSLNGHEFEAEYNVYSVYVDKGKFCIF